MKEKMLIDNLRSLVGASEKDTFLFFSSQEEAREEIFIELFINHVHQTGRNHFLVSNESPIFSRLEKLGLVIKAIPINEKGHLTKEALRLWISPRSTLFSISWANPLTGVIQPIWELADLCREEGVFFHVDASQVLGKLFFEFRDLSMDFLSFDGEALYGPKASGGLFAKENHIQQKRFDQEKLTLLDKAAKEMQFQRDHYCLEIARLRDYFEERILSMISDTQVFFKDVERVPHITAMSFPGAHANSLLFELYQKDMYAEIKDLETLLIACHIDPFYAKCSLSFQFSHHTTEDDVDKLLDALKKGTQKLRNLSRGLIPCG